MRKLYPIIFVSLVVLFSSCKEETEVFETDSLNNYMILQVGKYITYRIDSTVFTKSGSTIEKHKYQVKHTVSQEITDNTNRKTFVIQRLINNETATGPWLTNGSYLITPYDNKIEVVNDNLRVAVLQAPFKVAFSWKGNKALPFDPYKGLYNFDLVGYDLNDWDFKYTGFGNETIEGKSYNNVWTIEQHNKTLNIPPTPEAKFGTKEVSTEKYAKGIGLVYKDFQLYQYQAGSVDNPYPNYAGFAITMWAIDHN